MSEEGLEPSYLDENEVCAGLSEGDGDRGTYASCCARDEGCLSLEGEESGSGHGEYWCVRGRGGEGGGGECCRESRVC